MFKFVAIFALISISAAAVHRTSPTFHPPPSRSTHTSGSSEEAHAEIIKNDSDVRADGFDYVVETTNGIYAQASGDEHGNHHGEFHYVSHEGIPVKVTYVADENGFQPSGELLPTPPPTPDAILKSLAYNAAHPDKDDYSH